MLRISAAMQRIHDDAALVRLDRDEVLTAVLGHLADADLPPHAFTHHRKRVRRMAAVRCEVVRAIDVHRIDRRFVRELREVNHPR